MKDRWEIRARCRGKLHVFPQGTQEKVVRAVIKNMKTDPLWDKIRLLRWTCVEDKEQ